MSRVYLVGAGPGDPELLTVRAALLLRRAEIVLHDDLISQEILKLINPLALVINVGKRCGRKLLTQDETNSLLVHHARNNKVVIRLKGGDPTIFGRAGEEIDALREAGIAYEIVPGITSACAAAAAAGISLTDRRSASSVVFVTGHRGEGAEGSDWNHLAKSQSTLVIYMPGRDYGALADQLTAAGIGADTPCAVVSRAGLVDQKIFHSSVRHLNQTSMPAPSLVIVGSCAQQKNGIEAAPLQSVFRYQHVDEVSQEPSSTIGVSCLRFGTPNH